MGTMPEHPSDPVATGDAVVEPEGVVPPEPLTDGWEIKELLDHVLDAVVDSGECGVHPTTVVDLSGDEAVVLRVGGGDASRFE